MKSNSDSQKQTKKVKQSEKTESQNNSDIDQEDQNQKKKQSSVQMRKNKQSNNQRNNTNKSISQKESANVLENQQINLKKFRVFYGLIATFEDSKSPVHFNKIKSIDDANKNISQRDQQVKSSDIKLKQQDEIETQNVKVETQSTVIENSNNLNDQLTVTEKEIEGKIDVSTRKVFQQDNNDDQNNKLSLNQLQKEIQESKPNEQKKKRKNKNQLQKQESQQVKVSDLQSSQDLESELKQWFSNMTVDQRVNTLTTTSPYLADVLVNMQVATNKNGPTLFAKHLLASQQSSQYQKELYQQNLMHQKYPYQSASGYFGPNMSNYRQQYLSQYQSQQQISALQQHYSQSYGQQYFINGNFMYPQTQSKQLSKYQSYGSEIYSQFGLNYPYEYQMQREYDFFEYENQIQSDPPGGLSLNQASQNFLNSCNYQSKFEENFYQRVQCKNEIERSIQENQERHHAKENICQSIKFCDLFMYLDTISVSSNLVEDPEHFFEMLSQITQGNSFKQSCKFSADQENQKLQNIQIETPPWFKPQKFHSFAEWIAVIYEENLWANFNYYKAKQKKNPQSFITIQNSQEQAKQQQTQNQTQKQNSTNQKQNSHNILQSLQNLFEHKEINEYVGLSFQSCKIHTLASCWHESNTAQRKLIFDSLNSVLSEKSSQAGASDIEIQQSQDEFLQSGTFYYISINDDKNGSNQSSDLHLQNKRFDSEKIQLIIKKDEFQDIQKMALQSIQKLEQIELFENNQKSNDKQKNKKQHLNQIGQISENKSKIDQNLQKIQNIKSNIQSKQMNHQNSTILSIANLDTTFHSDLKYKQALAFIFSLFQTSIDRIENGKDYICRYFLKLIQQMHQEQLIQELIGGITSIPSKITSQLNDSKSLILLDQFKFNGENNKNQNIDAKNQKKKQKQLTQPQLKEQKTEDELIIQKKNKKKKKKKTQVKNEEISNIISEKKSENSIQQNIQQKMADNNDVKIMDEKHIKASENNEEGIEYSQMDMSDTISNNSAFLKENKKLEIFQDDTSMNLNSLIQTLLIQKEEKRAIKNQEDEDEWTYVENKQVKNYNQQISNEYVQIMLEKVLFITQAQSHGKIQEDTTQATDQQKNNEECSEKGIKINEVKSQNSNGYCVSQSESSQLVSIKKQDSENHTIIVEDQSKNNNKSDCNDQDQAIEDQKSDHNDAQLIESLKSSKIDANENSSFCQDPQKLDEIEIDEKDIQQQTTISKKFKSIVVADSKNADDEASQTNSTQQLKKKKKKKAGKISQQEAMNLFIIKQQSQNSEHLQSSLLIKKQNNKKESNNNSSALAKQNLSSVSNDMISPAQSQKYNESENNINKKQNKFDEQMDNSMHNRSNNRFQKYQKDQVQVYKQSNPSTNEDFKIINDKISPKKIQAQSQNFEYQQVQEQQTNKGKQHAQQMKYSSKQKLLNPENDQNMDYQQSDDKKSTNEIVSSQSNTYQQKRITHASKQNSQIYKQVSFNEFENQVSSWNHQNNKSSLNLESKEFKVSNQKQNQFYQKEGKNEYDNQLKNNQSLPSNQSSSVKEQTKKSHNYTYQQSIITQNQKQMQAYNDNEIGPNQNSQAKQINSKQKQKNMNQNSSNLKHQDNNQINNNAHLNKESENKERYHVIDNQRKNPQVNRKLDFHSQNNVQAFSENSLCVDNSFIDTSDQSVSSNSYFKNDQASYQLNHKNSNQNNYQAAVNPYDQKSNVQLYNQGYQLENNLINKSIYKYDQGQQLSMPLPFSQQNDNNQQVYQDSQNEIEQIQNQSSYSQIQPNCYPQLPGPGNTTSIAHINQMNQYNINSFPNMNLNQLQTSNLNQGHSCTQPSNQYYSQIQGMQNQLSYVNNNYQPSYDQQKMMQFGRNIDVNQYQNMQNYQMGMKHPHQLYDQNLPQNIECKFYEKFDNDIYDEVNNIQRHLNITKEERTFVLLKLQNLCEQVFQQKYEQEAQKQNKIDNLQISNKSKSYPSPNKNQKGNKNQIPKIRQFGSLVTGLALESSDMDMAVTNLYLPDREKMIESLDLFAENIKKWDMIYDLNAISTASIPVIKAVVDLKQLREKEMISLQDSQKDQDQFSQDFWQSQASSNSTVERNYYNQLLQRPQIPESLQKLKIDITFDDNIIQDDDEDNKYEFGMNMGFTPPHYFLTKQSFINVGLMENKTHLGISSCKLIKHYVETYKCLKEVSIVLKLYLSNFQLNSPYHGGVSSYSTVLLLVAYMNKWNLRMSPTLTPSRLLMGFLDYYSYYFNVSLFGIDVSNNGSFFEHGSPESYFVILDPLNDNNNTTKNSFLTHEIIKSFRKAFNSLKNQLIQYQQQQNTNINDNLLDIILERNKQNEIESDQKSNQQVQINKEEAIQNQQTQQTQTEELVVEHCKQISQQLQTFGQNR